MNRTCKGCKYYYLTWYLLPACRKTYRIIDNLEDAAACKCFEPKKKELKGKEEE